ncbi:MAG: glycosyltransferase, partial [Nitrososphaeraceae archaeon]
MTRIKKSEIRILQVTPWFPPHIGGIAGYVSDLCIHMISQGYSITVLTVKRLTEDSPNNTGYQSIEYMNCFYLPGWPYPTLRSLSIPIDVGVKLNSCIKKGNFDIIH